MKFIVSPEKNSTTRKRVKQRRLFHKLGVTNRGLIYSVSVIFHYFQVKW